MLNTNPSYRVVLSADIEKSAGRGDQAMIATRTVLMTAMKEALAASGLDWIDCHVTDLGDGVRLVLAPGTPKAKLVDPFLSRLAALFLTHNRSAPDRERIRIRMAMHAGEVSMSEGEVIGRPLEMLARLLEAPPLRAALAGAPASRTVAVGMSEHFHDDVVAHDHPGIPADLFRRSRFVVKETDTAIWLYVPGYAVTDASPHPDEGQQVRPSESTNRWTISGRTVQVAADHAHVGQQVGRVVHHASPRATDDALELDRVRALLADLRRDIVAHERAGRLEPGLYEAAVDELRAADESLDEDGEPTRARFVLALRRLKGLIDEFADLAAKVVALIQAARGLGG